MAKKPIRSQDAKAREALEFARERARSAQSWIELHNALFGIGGKFAELFTSDRERTAFTATVEFRTIQQLIEELRGRKGDGELADLAASANGSVIVRMPKSLHAALLGEAQAEGVSLNQLCVAKLAMQLRALCGQKRS